MAAYVDDWADDGSDSPDLQAIGYGMVNFGEDQTLGTVSYLGGIGTATDPEAHVAEKWAPFLFPNYSSAETTASMLLEAWDALIYANVPGFRDVDPDQIRVVDSAQKFQTYPRGLLQALESEKVFETHDDWH